MDSNADSKAGCHDKNVIISDRRNLIDKPQFFDVNALSYYALGGQDTIRIQWPHPDLTNVDAENEDEDKDDKELSNRKDQ